MAKKRKKHGVDGEVRDQATSSAEQQAADAQGTKGVSRRGFVVKTAEVAAMSLFGVAALDDVLRAVAGRVRDIGNGDRFARAVAHELDGMTAVAHADWCLYTHMCAGDYDCGDPPFACGAGFPVIFQCDDQGIRVTFACDAPEFECRNEFACPENYLCVDWDCADVFRCNGEDGVDFECRGGAGAVFGCVGQDFHCNDEAQDDFACNDGAAFTCDPAGDRTFQCGFGALGTFECLPEGLFTCQVFECDPNQHYGVL